MRAGHDESQDLLILQPLSSLPTTKHVGSLKLPLYIIYATCCQDETPSYEVPMLWIQARYYNLFIRLPRDKIYSFEVLRIQTRGTRGITIR